MSRVFLLWAACALGACTTRSPQPEVAKEVAKEPPAAPKVSERAEKPAAEPTVEAADPGASGAPDEARAPEPEKVPVAVPVLLDDAGQALPQTDERPRVDSETFQQRLLLLVEAIRTDEPSVALPAFFPMVAYEQVKAIAKPQLDWERRLVKAFERNIHEYHRQLGKHASNVRLVALELPEARVKFMKPHTEGNRLGYYRVTRSQLRLSTSDGKEHSLGITSMISWRGEWYVVHLNGYE